MPRHQRFERIARTEVVKSTVPRYNLSAMIVKGGRIVARGVNRMSRDRSVHAEVAALSQMIRRKANPEGAEIHVYRFWQMAVMDWPNRVKSVKRHYGMQASSEFGILMTTIK